MKKSNIKVIVVLLIIIEIISLFLTYKSFTNSQSNLKETDGFKKSEIFAIMIEQTDGIYREDDSLTKWPSTGYIYNGNLSGCVDLNGNVLSGILSYDSDSNIAEVTTNQTVMCYLYFDKIEEAYAIYSQDDNSLTFIRSKIKPLEGNKYNNKTITAVFEGFEENVYDSSAVPWEGYREKIKTVEVVDKISPISTSYWFWQCEYISYFDLEKLNTKNVTDMTMMFYYAGEYADTVTINVKNWDVSNVINMRSLFGGVGSDSSLEVNINGLENWDTSNVTNMAGVFVFVGRTKATTVNIGDISGWDTSNVTNMTNMFLEMGRKANYSLDLSGWDVSKVTSYNDFNTYVSTKVKAPSFGT